MKPARLLYPGLLLTLLFSLGCGNKASAPANSSDNSANNSANGTGQEAQTSAPKPLVIPAGKVITIRLSQQLSSKGNHDGESFSGTVAEPIQVDGETAIARGASAHGTVVAAKAMGHFKGGALLQLRLDSVTIKGERRSVETSTWSQELKGKGKRSAIAIGGGAGLGAALGGIFGGGKGAAIGAAAGAGAGTAGAAFTGNKEIELPAESALRFTIRRSIEVR